MVRMAKRLVATQPLTDLVSAELVFSIVVLSGTLTLIAKNQVHPVLMYCLQLFLAA